MFFRNIYSLDGTAASLWILLYRLLLLRFWRGFLFLYLCCYCTYSTHATPEPLFVDGFVGSFDNSDVPIFLHGLELALKSIHEIRCSSRILCLGPLVIIVWVHKTPIRRFAREVLLRCLILLLLPIVTVSFLLMLTSGSHLILECQEVLFDFNIRNLVISSDAILSVTNITKLLRGESASTSTFSILLITVTHSERLLLAKILMVLCVYFWWMNFFSILKKTNEI